MHRALSLVVVSIIAAAVQAQQPGSIIRIRVVDTARAPVASADVVVLRGLTDAVANGVTDASGGRRFVVPRGNDELQIVARRVGFQRADVFFRADRDSVALVLVMRLAPRELPAVQISADADLKRKRYHATADDIAASTRPIYSGLDVVTKLRPDMMDPPGQGLFDRCGLYYLWINGERIVFPPIDPGLAIATSQQRRGARAVANKAAGRSPNYTGLMTVPVSVQSALSRIRPEHIDEMNYVDCRDASNELVNGRNALFVLLKPGIGYDMVRGSYVVDHEAREAASALDTARRQVAPRVIPAHRNRIIGVFDEMTGEPVAGAEIVDVATGSFVRTSATGTAGLSWLPEGNSVLVVRFAGFAELKVDVTISPRDTVPITLILSRKPNSDFLPDLDSG
jgi:hypothetical protein